MSVNGCKRGVPVLRAVPLDHVTSKFLLEQSPIGTGIKIKKHEMAPGEKIESV